MPSLPAKHLAADVAALQSVLGGRVLNEVEFPDSMGHDTSWWTVGLADTPVSRAMTYATLGLHAERWPERVGAPGVELLAVSRLPVFNWMRMLAGVASWVRHNRILPGPGLLLRGATQKADLPHAERMPHLLATVPWPWDPSIAALRLSGGAVLPVLMVAIGEREAQFVEVRGADALEELFDEREVDVFDLERIPLEPDPTP